MTDLFHTMLDREALADLYINSHNYVYGTDPTDVRSLNRAGLVDRLEKINADVRAKYRHDLNSAV